MRLLRKASCSVGGFIAFDKEATQSITKMIS